MQAVETSIAGIKARRVAPKKGGGKPGAANAAASVAGLKLEKRMLNCLCCGKVYDARNEISADVSVFLGEHPLPLLLQFDPLFMWLALELVSSLNGNRLKLALLMCSTSGHLHCRQFPQFRPCMRTASTTTSLETAS